MKSGLARYLWYPVPPRVVRVAKTNPSSDCRNMAAAVVIYQGNVENVRLGRPLPFQLIMKRLDYTTTFSTPLAFVLSMMTNFEGVL